MTEKILHEFSTRITRAKTVLDTTKHQCSLLKKEALRLEKANKWNSSDHSRNMKKFKMLVKTPKWWKSLSRTTTSPPKTAMNKVYLSQITSSSESQKNAKEYEELNQLRELKKKL